MLSVTEYDITDISDTEAVYQDLSCMHVVYNFCFLIAEFQYIT